MAYILFSCLFWILYSFFEGVREANANHHKELSKSIIELKSPMVYNIQRMLILIALNLHIFSHLTWWAIPSLISMILIFPYIHNGTYFIIRNKLNPEIFKKKACEDCQNIEKRPSIYLKNCTRTKLALVGIILLILICFIK